MIGKAFVAAIAILLAFGCVQNVPVQNGTNNSSLPNNTLVPVNQSANASGLHLICQGSICCQGFGDTCATFQCADNIYYKPGGMDAASLFINGSSGVIVARCGGNIAPINPGLCQQIEGTCDMAKPAASVPDAVNNPKNP